MQEEEAQEAAKPDEEDPIADHYLFDKLSAPSDAEADQPDRDAKKEAAQAKEDPAENGTLPDMDARTEEDASTEEEE